MALTDDPDRLNRRRLRLRYPATCAVCGRVLARGEEAWWNAVAKEAACLTCESSDAKPASEAAGTAGASARREHDRRHANREARMKARFGDRLGGFAFRVTDDPQSTRAWKTGAVGEERLARFLSRELPEAAIVLHDRRIPGSKANIDHVIVAAAGIWVVDAKLYEGRVERRMLGPFWNQQPAVFVGGRNQTKLVRGMARQVEAVRASLAHDPLAQTVPISPAVCFVASDWGLFARPFEIDGVLVVWPQKLVERIASPGPLAAADVGRIASGIAASLPSAVRS